MRGNLNLSKMAVGYSLSTSWNWSRHKSGADIINEIREAGFDTVELNFNLTEEVVNDIHGMFKKSLVKVSSVHNICPVPEGLEPQKASPDYYSLSSDDREERRLAVCEAKKTISCANRFAAKAVVFHCGRVDIKDRTVELAAASVYRDLFLKLKGAMIDERSKNAGRGVENVIKSFKELLPFADDHGLMLAIENRFYFREIPLMDEMEEIFSHFKKDSLYYWHDVGHAEVFERLSFYKHAELLNKFGNRLIGIHLHDIIGNRKDHQPPGAGSFDFSKLKPYLKNDTIKVIEAHQPASSSDLRASVEYLDKVLS